MSHPALTFQDKFANREAFAARFQRVRQETLDLTEGLSAEDMQIQTMEDVSPAKWHLAHVTWFFETFLLGPFSPGYEVFHPRFNYLFNSYYEAVGEKWSRPERGFLSRPLLSDILDYRMHVDSAMTGLIETLDDAGWRDAAPLIELGLHHEQQHQELLLTDIKHVLSQAPDPHAPFAAIDVENIDLDPVSWLSLPGGIVEIGSSGDGFVYDNELPRHKRFMEECAIASRPVSNGEFADFIADGGYQNPALWLSDGWAWVNENTVRHPLYWRGDEEGWREYTLHGLNALNPSDPVCHVSAYEAAAFAEWSGHRLPTETELELLAIHYPAEANLLHREIRKHPNRLKAGPEAQAVVGGVWEWTSSGYEAYPGYRPPDGAVGEYNGKFMSGQQVLRGGSCATPHDHIRATYRNFFPSGARWQFTGIRLAQR